MTSFETEYRKLNSAQKQAVDHIDGPLMVIAGPGTGKTQLLAMRAANILKKTDTMPQNILCLTFTESGAEAMRQRLTSIIGADAYKIAIHTFHGFGTEIINMHREYFYQGAQFLPASDIQTNQILHDIFETLPHNNPLARTMNDQFPYLPDVRTVISELKRNGLSTDELRAILDDNQRIMDACQSAIAEVFAVRISKTTKDLLRPIVQTISDLPQTTLPFGTNSLAQVLALSLAAAIETAEIDNSTKPITAWRTAWLEKNSQGQLVFKDQKRTTRLRAAAEIYQRYNQAMQKQQLFDFDDMILSVTHGLETHDDLRYNLQEKYLYIMVDEFQDTNAAQARILHALTEHPTTEGAPNLMVVGDDDQAIYSFQGAEISNIRDFRHRFEQLTRVDLKDNYRSSEPILTSAREIITQGNDRLEKILDDLDKTLTPHHTPEATAVTLQEFAHQADEYDWVARQIAARIKAGTPPDEITVIARRHQELVALLPYLSAHHIVPNYERRENILEDPLIVQLELLARFVLLQADQRLAEANALLPEILAHPAWQLTPETIWQLSLESSQKHQLWLQTMEEIDELRPIHSLFITWTSQCKATPLELMIDQLLGSAPTDDATITSPYFDYYFTDTALDQHYLDLLDALRTLRAKLRDYTAAMRPTLRDLIDYIDAERQLNHHILSVRSRTPHDAARINLMTAHKSKGLEFDHVFIVGVVDTAWGERVRRRSRLIGYPHNLPLAPAGDTYDERLRLFFVAATRAKSHLDMSYSLDKGSAASFLVETGLTPQVQPPSTVETAIQTARTDWFTPVIDLPEVDITRLLAPLLQRYKLSATHLNAFLDVSRGGPQLFLRQNLLRFPQGMSVSAIYGSVYHATLQQAHDYVRAHGVAQTPQQIIDAFVANLKASRLPDDEYQRLVVRGQDCLKRFLDEMHVHFAANQQPELNFAAQQSQLGQARLTGSLDLVTIDTSAKTIIVTDYKTGKPAPTWQGKTDFEKIKLHKYRQQLMFYTLLIRHSRDYSAYRVIDSVLQFVEPTDDGQIVSLHASFSEDELDHESRLIGAVWQSIMDGQFPDTSQFESNLGGIMAFEDWLLGGKK